MNKPWKVILVFIGVFLFGTITGGLVAVRWYHPPIRRPNLERFAQNRVAHLTHVLRCTPDQRDKLEVIVLQASMNLRRVRENSIRQAMSIFDNMDSRIETVLNPEQRIKFEDLRRIEKERFRGFMHHADEHKPGMPNQEQPPGDAKPEPGPHGPGTQPATPSAPDQT